MNSKHDSGRCVGLRQSSGQRQQDEEMNAGENKQGGFSGTQVINVVEVHSQEV